MALSLTSPAATSAITALVKAPARFFVPEVLVLYTKVVVAAFPNILLLPLGSWYCSVP